MQLNSTASNFLILFSLFFIAESILSAVIGSFLLNGRSLLTTCNLNREHLKPSLRQLPTSSRLMRNTAEEILPDEAVSLSDGFFSGAMFQRGNGQWVPGGPSHTPGIHKQQDIFFTECWVTGEWTSREPCDILIYLLAFFLRNRDDKKQIYTGWNSMVCWSHNRNSVMLPGIWANRERESCRFEEIALRTLQHHPEEIGSNLLVCR